MDAMASISDRVTDVGAYLREQRDEVFRELVNAQTIEPYAFWSHVTCVVSALISNARTA